MNTTTAIGAAIVTATAIAGAALIYNGVPNSNNSNQPSANTVQLKADKPCDPSLWQRVYHGRFKTAQDRLTVLNPCVTVVGILVASKEEPDGDRHLRISPSPEFRGLLNAKNISDQGGNLVVEPVCVSAPSQRDAVAEGVCNGYHSPLVIPPVGTRVSVTGSYVEDQAHGWREIHPVSFLDVVH